MAVKSRNFFWLLLASALPVVLAACDGDIGNASNNSAPPQSASLELTLPSDPNGRRSIRALASQVSASVIVISENDSDSGEDGLGEGGIGIGSDSASPSPTPTDSGGDFGSDEVDTSTSFTRSDTNDGLSIQFRHNGSFTLSVDWTDNSTGLSVATLQRSFSSLSNGTTINVNREDYITDFDADGDGLTNLQEVNQGSDPTNINSPFVVQDSCNTEFIGFIGFSGDSLASSNCAIDFEGDIDEIIFQPLESGTFLEVFFTSSLDLVLEILDPSGQLVASLNVDDSFLITELIGSYTIRVLAFNGTGPYQIVVNSF